MTEINNTNKHNLPKNNGGFVAVKEQNRNLIFLLERLIPAELSSVAVFADKLKLQSKI